MTRAALRTISLDPFASPDILRARRLAAILPPGLIGAIPLDCRERGQGCQACRASLLGTTGGAAVTETLELIDIHCHLLPGVDDGARRWDEAIEMARIARADGIGTIIATARQLGSYAHISGERIRACTRQLQDELTERGIAVQVLPGADVRAQSDVARELMRGEVLTLADQRRHLLVDLPPASAGELERLMRQLVRGGIATIVARAERHPDFLREPRRVRELVERGCLMQITAGSLLGSFGAAAQGLGEWMLREDLAHFVATDARGARSQRPLLRLAYERVGQLVGGTAARRICYEYPAAIAEGRPIELPPRAARTRALTRWIRWRRAA